MKQIRIVILGDWGSYLSYFLMGSMEGAIRNEVWCRPVDLFQSINKIRKQIMWFKPDIIVTHCIFAKRFEEIGVLDLLSEFKEKGIKIFYHMGDARSVPRYPNDISKYIDFCLINHGLTKEFSKIWKVPCYQWPYMSLYQRSFGNENKDFKYDVIFTGRLNKGHLHHGFRTDFIEKLQERIKVKVFPNEKYGNTRFETAEVAVSANAVLGVQMGLDIPMYIDVRPFQYIGAGALYFHDRCDVMRAFFQPGYHYVEYERGEVKDFLDKYNYYVKKYPKKGKRIREQGFQFCQTFHSTKERVGFILDVFQNSKVKNLIYLKDLPV